MTRKKCTFLLLTFKFKSEHLYAEMGMILNQKPKTFFDVILISEFKNLFS